MVVAGGEVSLHIVCPFHKLSVGVAGGVVVLSSSVPSKTGFEPSASPGRTPLSPSLEIRRKSAREAMGVTRVLHRKSRLEVVFGGPFQLRGEVLFLVRRVYFLWAR